MKIGGFLIFFNNIFLYKYNIKNLKEGRELKFIHKKQLKGLFSMNGWSIIHIDETEMNRYASPKVCWEFLVKKL